MISSTLFFVNLQAQLSKFQGFVLQTRNAADRLLVMQRYRVILVIGIIEVLIGLVTLSFNLLSLLFQTNTKSPGVFLFVCLAAIISTALGLGLLLFRHWAYNLLLYFSTEDKRKTTSLTLLLFS